MISGMGRGGVRRSHRAEPRRDPSPGLARAGRRPRGDPMALCSRTKSSPSLKLFSDVVSTS